MKVSVSNAWRVLFQFTCSIECEGKSVVCAYLALLEVELW